KAAGAWRLNELIPKHVIIKGRLFIIAFDADSADNEHVRMAARQLTGMLLDAGAARVLFVRIPKGPGANGAKFGIDDYYVTHGEAAARALLEQGEPIEPLPVDSPCVPLTAFKPLEGAPINPKLR